jgi:hypothetical protein
MEVDLSIRQWWKIIHQVYDFAPDPCDFPIKNFMHSTQEQCRQQSAIVHKSLPHIDLQLIKKNHNV